MLSSPVVDDDLDRPKVEAERSVELIGTNRTCGLAYCFTYCRASSAATSPEGLLDRPRRELQPPFRSPAPRLFAGGHGGAAIPVPIPNTEVKGSIAEGSASFGRARVGRRRLFFFRFAQKASHRRPPDAPPLARPSGSAPPRGIRRLFFCPQRGLFLFLGAWRRV